MTSLDQAKAPSGLDQQLRGSSLLLVGRGVGVLLNLIVQLLLVKTLARNDYGSFGVALAAVSIGTNINLMGLGRGLSRLGPYFQEKDGGRALLGAIAVAFLAITSLGALFVSGALIFDGAWQPLLSDDPITQELLLSAVILVPLGAVDSALEVLAAGLVGARAIFLRRHLLTPLMRLVAVCAVAASGGGAAEIILAYVIATLIGIATYIGILRRSLKGGGLQLGQARDWPASKVLKQGASYMFVDVATVFSRFFPILILEAARGPDTVAGFRAAFALIAPIGVVLQSIKLLYVPLVARSSVGGPANSTRDAHWTAMVWIAVFTFPIFAACAFVFPFFKESVLGPEYSDIGAIIVVLSVVEYVHMTLRVNVLTLQAEGHTKELRRASFVTVVVTITACLTLTPHYGALGAAWAVAIGAFSGDAVTTWLCSRVAVGALPRKHVLPFALLFAASAALLLGVVLLRLPAHVAIPFTALVVGFVCLRSCRSLELLSVFPELKRVRVLRGIL